jgi:hypothetical protein
MSMVMRWVRAVPEGDGAPPFKCREFSRRMELADGSVIFQAGFRPDELAAAQAVAGVTVLPSLTAPASRLPAAVTTWLAGQGITPAAGDTVLNVLRALRDKFGGSFDVDLDY